MAYAQVEPSVPSSQRSCCRSKRLSDLSDQGQDREAAPRPIGGVLPRTVGASGEAIVAHGDFTCRRDCESRALIQADLRIQTVVWWLVDYRHTDCLESRMAGHLALVAEVEKWARILSRGRTLFFSTSHLRGVALFRAENLQFFFGVLRCVGGAPRQSPALQWDDESQHNCCAMATESAGNCRCVPYHVYPLYSRGLKRSKQPGLSKDRVEAVLRNLDCGIGLTGQLSVTAWSW